MSRSGNRTHCIHGHELTEENKVYRSNGGFICRVCRTENMRARWERVRPEPVTAESRFKAKIHIGPIDCWLWQGKIDKDGFPKFMVDRKDCFVHRWAYQQYVGPLPEKSRLTQVCGDKTCVNPEHLQMELLHQDAKRFQAKYEILENGCWQWLDALNSSGYGTFSVDCHKVTAHRYSWERVNGLIPEGLVIDHLCRNRGCVNPDHLEIVTQKENCLRGDPEEILGSHLRNKTHCPQGHPYEGDNLHINKAGGRVCRACSREHTRICRLRKKAIETV